MENIKYEVKTGKSFNEAVQSIEESLGKNKFGVLWKLNFKDKLKEKGIDFDRNFMILEVCNPFKASEVLTKHIDVGYFLPCKVVVYEDAESVKIGMLNTATFLGMLGYEDLEGTAEEVQNILISAINDAK